jgi:parvulin-like peptidyl-prolyl isomerase
MKIPAKVIAVIAVVVGLAGAGLWAQRASSSVKPVKLTARDMEVLFREVLPPEMQQRTASNPDEKKKLLDDLKNIFAVAQQAELEGYADRPDVQARVTFAESLTLFQAYKKKNPDAKATDEEVKAFLDANPAAYETFVRGSKGTRFEIQPQDAQREEVKKSVGQVLALVERARGEKLDQDEVVRTQLLFNRSNVLASTYENELSKKVESEITDEEVQNYYNTHRDKFDQVQVSRIVISTGPAGDDGHGHEDEEEGEAEKHQSLTPEQARQKAEQVLARLRGGEDFAKVAAEVSDDPTSRTGDSTFISRMNVQPEFKNLVDTAFALKPGEVSDVLEIQDSFYIIKAGERKAGASPAENPAARQAIKEMIKDEKLQARIDDIVARSRVEIAENFDSTPKPQQQPGPAQTQ